MAPISVPLQKVSVVLLNAAPLTLRYEVVRSGRILLEAWFAYTIGFTSSKLKVSSSRPEAHNSKVETPRRTFTTEA